MSASSARIDLAAISGNVAHLKSRTTADVMAVVKADGYGHGLLPASRAALHGGASWLGVAMLDEALTLRAAGIEAPTLVWLWSPSETESLAACVGANVDISVNGLPALALVVAAAAATGTTARVHLKLDTGLSRNGAYVTEWPALVAAAASADGVEVMGVWSHFVYADAPGHPTNAAQLERFRAGLEVAERAGLRPQLRHLANSAATLTLPDAHFDLVRPGIAVYGLNPVPQVPAPGLTPAMTLRSEVALAKRVAAGEGVSYGHQYVTAAETTLALVPLGYADGIPRAAMNLGPVQIGAGRYRIAGRVCMDQFVLDVGDAEVRDGAEVLLFGPGLDGEPTAQDWADALDTIHYEIVTRIGSRVPREYVGSHEPEVVGW
ncbi:MAG: alanine racemase [Jatrophihabitans sp.]